MIGERKDDPHLSVVLIDSRSFLLLSTSKLEQIGLGNQFNIFSSSFSQRGWCLNEWGRKERERREKGKRGDQTSWWIVIKQWWSVYKYKLIQAEEEEMYIFWILLLLPFRFISHFLPIFLYLLSSFLSYFSLESKNHFKLWTSLFLSLSFLSFVKKDFFWLWSPSLFQLQLRLPENFVHSSSPSFSHLTPPSSHSSLLSFLLFLFAVTELRNTIHHYNS